MQRFRSCSGPAQEALVLEPRALLQHGRAVLAAPARAKSMPLVTHTLVPRDLSSVLILVARDLSSVLILVARDLSSVLILVHVNR